jgi:hypothetical protein
MRCACNRWGPGTTCEKPSNTAASKELQDRLTAMRNERTTQDKMWDTEPEKKDILITTTNQQQLTTQVSKYTGGR